MYEKLTREELENRLKEAEKIIEGIHVNKVYKKKPDQREWVLAVIAEVCKKYMEEFHA